MCYLRIGGSPFSGLLFMGFWILEEGGVHVIEFMKKCNTCQTNKDASQYLPHNSPIMDMWVTVPICTKCLLEKVDIFDFAAVDGLCRWLNVPFIPNEWVKMYREFGLDVLDQYVRKMVKGEYPQEDWKKYNDLWKTKLRTNEIMEELEELKSVYMDQMRRNWKMKGSFEKFMALENYYDNMSGTRNIKTEAQKDVLRKVCKLAYAADEAIETGTPADIKNLTGIYMNMLKQSGMLDEDAIRDNEVDCVGRLYEHMARTGWMPEFYDGTARDIVDATIADIQKTNARLILGDDSISEIVEAKMKKAKVGLVTDKDIGGSGDIQKEIEELKKQVTKTKGKKSKRDTDMMVFGGDGDDS